MNESIFIVSQFNWIDWFIIAIVLFFAFLGARQGFIKGIVSIIVWVMATLVSYYSANILAGKYPGVSQSEAVRFWLFFIPVFFLTWFVGRFIAWALPTSLKDSDAAGIFNKSLGFILGGLKSIFLIGILFCILNTVPYIKNTVSWQKSTFKPYILMTTNWIYKDIYSRVDNSNLS